LRTWYRRLVSVSDGDLKRKINKKNISFFFIVFIYIGIRSFLSSVVRWFELARHRIILVVVSWDIEGGWTRIVVVDVVVTVFVDEVDDGRRDLTAEMGVMICKTGDRDGVGLDGAGFGGFSGENISKSSKLTISGSFDVDEGTGNEGDWGTMAEDEIGSLVVRCRFRTGVCEDETDGERERCFRIWAGFDGTTFSIGVVSSTSQPFSLLLVRSYSASETNGVNFDFFFFKGDWNETKKTSMIRFCLMNIYFYTFFLDSTSSSVRIPRRILFIILLYCGRWLTLSSRTSSTLSLLFELCSPVNVLSKIKSRISILHR